MLKPTQRYRGMMIGVIGGVVKEKGGGKEE